MPKTSGRDLAVDVDADGQRLPLSVARVRALATLVLERERTRRALLSVAFVSPRAIGAMNRRHLHQAGATDVITFALGRPGRGAPLVGDIYIAPEVVRAQARDAGIAVREELARVVIHGVLHALGYDHPEDASRLRSAMWRRQERHLAHAKRMGVL